MIGLLKEWIGTSEEILDGTRNSEQSGLDILAIVQRRDQLMPLISEAVSTYTEQIRATGLSPDSTLLEVLGRLSVEAEEKDFACIERITNLVRETGEGLGGLRTARKVGNAYLKRATRGTSRFLDTGT